MAHETEEEAFAQFMNVFPQHSVLLIDTYDVRAAIGKSDRHGPQAARRAPG